MKIKKILALLCVVALAVVSVVGTLAYLTDQAAAKNTFTVGKVNITLDEAKVDELGEPVDPEDRVTENEYKLIPGQTYVKDPTVTVKAGSEKSYVRMMVTITDAKDVKAVFGSDFLPEKYVSDWDKNVWQSYGITEDADSITYEFRYYDTVDASQATEDVVLAALFKNFTVPGDISGEDLEKLDGMKILVEGHAIQAAGFEDADAAWVGFADQQERDAEKETTAPSEP